MSRAKQWNKIFGNSRKPTVTVRVGEKVEEMTDTQAFRFGELTQTNSGAPKALNRNPLDQSNYSLEDAAFRLMISESDILKQAAAGSIKLYTDVAGLTGRWRRIDVAGGVIESSMRTLRSGYLGLTAPSCKELASGSSTNVIAFDFPEIPDPSILNLEFETLQELAAWGREKKCFFVNEPRRVDHDAIVLLAPLVASS